MARHQSNTFQSTAEGDGKSSHRSTRASARNNTSASAILMNHATVDPIFDDAKIVIQTPIMLSSDSDLTVEGSEESTLIDTLNMMNTASFEHIRGIGNIVIQIPILVIDAIHVDELTKHKKNVHKFLFTNIASAGPVEGKGNVVIQIPILLVDDYHLDSEDLLTSIQNRRNIFSAAIENVARNSLIRGERNLIIQVPVQLTPNISQLSNSHKVSTTIL